ncbi:MAG: DUF2829 domain-containing protein [Prevotella sp.]|jgi:hypothetical protein|nr:DUF2829 domain-containing protein [Prevotella sp.]
MTLNSKENLSFGDALEAVKSGKAVARNGWNGKGMCIYLNKGSVDFDLPVITESPKYPYGSTIDGVDLGLFEPGDTGTVTRLPNINMKTAGGSTVTGWLASQTDMLAEDWCILD